MWCTLKGIYILIIQLQRNSDITVGKLGTLHFPKGLYAYVGSAQVALEKRIERHLRKEKKLFWHIDYLLQNSTAKILEIFMKTASKREECTFAKQIATRSETVAGFGCSDCSCRSHLIRVSHYDFLRGFMRLQNEPNPSASS